MSKESKTLGKRIKDFLNLKELASGEGWLNTPFAKKQAGVLILLVVLSFFYTGNRYSCEKQLAKIDKLQKELTEVKYTYLTISSELMTLSRQSKVEKIIQAKGINLEKSTVPPHSVQQ